MRSGGAAEGAWPEGGRTLVGSRRGEAPLVPPAARAAGPPPARSSSRSLSLRAASSPSAAAARDLCASLGLAGTGPAPAGAFGERGSTARLV